MRKIVVIIAFIVAGVSSYINAQNITSLTVDNGISFCTGSTLSATTTTSGTFGVGNSFSAILSDATGSFSSGTTQLVVISGDAGAGFSVKVPNVSNQGSLYRLKVKASNPATELISSVNLTINQTASISMLSTNLCSNSTPIQITRYPSNGSYIGSSGAIGNNFYPSLAQIGLNTITYVIPSNGCTDTVSINVTVNQLPELPLLSGVNLLCPKSSSYLSITNYNALYTYDWYNGNVNLGVTNDSLQVNSAGSYKVTASNNSCSATSQANEVTISKRPSNFSVNAPSSICLGASPILLSGIPAGGSFDTSNVVGGYFTPSKVGTNTLTYTYQNQYGCIFDTSKIIVVNPSSTIIFNGTNALCLNAQPLNLKTLFTASNSVGGTISFSGAGVSDSLFNPTTAGVGGHTITCNFLNSSGCNSTMLGNITVLGNDNISFSIPKSICLGNDSIVLNASPLNGTFSGNGVINGVFYPNKAGVGNQIVSYTSSNSNTTCSSTKSASITVYKLTLNAGLDVTATCGVPANLSAISNYAGSSTIGYSWDNAKTLSNASISNPIASPISTTSYVVKANVDGCSAEDTVNLTINSAQFNVTFSNQSTFTLPPFNVAFSNNTLNPFLYSFSWDFGDGTLLNSNSLTVVHQYLVNDSFNVSLTAKSIQTGCSNTYTVNNAVITSNACSHVAKINETSPIVGCSGDKILLSCNSIANAQYQWNLNGYPISGAPNTSYLATQSGSYTVTIFLNNCPQSSKPVQVTLNASPANPSINVVGSIVFCGGGSSTLQANAGFQTYQWKKNGVAIGNQSQVLTIYETGYYSVSAYDANGCSSSSAQQAVNSSFLSAPNMCVVSIDTITNKPILEWEKPINLTPIKNYILMRESTIANVYDTIKVNGNSLIPVTALSSVRDVDAVVNTNVKSYKYKLALQDTCESTTLPSSYHKTILLQASVGLNNQVNLLWNNYEGVPIATYDIMRGTSLNKLHTLASVAASSGQTNFYTDVVPNAKDTFYYRIDLVLPSGYECDPSLKKSERAKRKLSQSNVGSNKSVEGEDTESINETTLNNSFHIAPNPSNGNFQVSYHTTSNENVSIDVISLLGSNVHTETWNVGSLEGSKMLHLSQLESGIYFITFKQGNKANTTKVIISK